MLTNHYQGEIQLEPTDNLLLADLYFTFFIKKNNTSTLELYLYKNFYIQSIQSDDVLNYEFSEKIANWSPSILESKLLRINLKRPYQKGDKIILHMVYRGTVNIVSKWQVNRLTEEFVELGLYSPYFPLTKDLQLSTFNLEVTLPEDYYLINGFYQQKSWRIIKKNPTNDCTLIASKQFKKISTVDHLSVHYINNQSEQAAKKINEYCQRILDYYNELFTETNCAQNISIVILPREIGGGYCRPGLIVFPNIIDEDQVSIRFLAHEISHLWWNKSINTNSWEDWLNEAFAEFSSLMVYRDYYGETKFKQLIEKYEKKAKDALPIYDINRSDETAYTVLYVKGAVILYQLEKEIGKERLIHFLKLVHLNQIKETKNLLELLASIEGDTISKHLQEALEK